MKGELDSLQPRSRIFHMQGACFAWPRQYYYHIFHIMRPCVCLFISRETNLSLLSPSTILRHVKREIESGFFFLTSYHSLLAPLLFMEGLQASRTTTMKSLYVEISTSIGEGTDFLKIFTFRNERKRIAWRRRSTKFGWMIINFNFYPDRWNISHCEFSVPCKLD